MKLYHGTERAALKLRSGICFTEAAWAAAEYGSRVHEVDADFSGLTVLEVKDADTSSGRWPGDTEASRDHYEIELGADIIFFVDQTPDGTRHETYRFLSDESIEALKVLA